MAGLQEKVKDLYKVLDVERHATTKQLKAAYRKLAAKWHPDVCKEENAQEIFEEIVEAYETLSDSEERSRYDQFVKENEEKKGMTFESLYHAFHYDEQKAYAPIKGDNVEIVIEFTMEEVRQGATKETEFERYVNCEPCEGHGFHKNIESKCSVCHGSGSEIIERTTPFGTIKSEKKCQSCEGFGFHKTTECTTCKGKGKKGKMVTINFSLPNFTTDGERLTVKGKGDEGLNGGRNGDLIFLFKQSKKDPFRLEGHDAFLTIEVPYKKALNGGKVLVALPRGVKVDVEIPKGIDSGHRIILPNEGLFNPLNHFYGNLTLTVQITTQEKKTG